MPRSRGHGLPHVTRELCKLERVARLHLDVGRQLSRQLVGAQRVQQQRQRVVAILLKGGAVLPETHLPRRGQVGGREGPWAVWACGQGVGPPRRTLRLRWRAGRRA
eukprot:4971328-Prymnesium_polylepis.1